MANGDSEHRFPADEASRASTLAAENGRRNNDHTASYNDNDDAELRENFAMAYMGRPPVTSPQSFTPRSLAVGLLIGALVTFSNTYFGLQTGWISTMAMPSALIGFSVFKVLSKHLSFPFTPIENVLIQTVAGAVGTMPLGCGFVGVIPALEFLLRRGDDGLAGDGGDGEGGPLKLGFWKLCLWSLGVCLFGVVFAVPLRKEVIIRENLKFPSGTASALMLKVLHGNGQWSEKAGLRHGHRSREDVRREDGEDEPLSTPTGRAESGSLLLREDDVEKQSDKAKDWKSKMRLLIGAFVISGIYTLSSYFVPQVRDVPIFGASFASNWLWTLNPSPAYVGQGIIMGPSTCMHMLFGAVLGWGILSPLAKARGWAPGPVDDWESGSKGWIVWVSLAIMLADSIVSLGWLVIRPLVTHRHELKAKLFSSRLGRLVTPRSYHTSAGYSALNNVPDQSTPGQSLGHAYDKDDAPPSQLISKRTVSILLPLTLVLNVFCMHIVFGDVMSPVLSSFATLLAVLLSVMGVRALGETDLNPVSGISKLTQLLFSLATPTSQLSRRTAVVTNLLAGAVSESGALQAGDMMQDLKTGHLLGASPKAQFYGQIIGSLVGAILSTAVYKMYVKVYDIPGPMFQTPTAYVWLFTARLVTGQGLPRMAWQASLIAGTVFVAITVLRIVAASPVANGGARGVSTPWRVFVPGGIAVAVGMFNVPSFTLARAIGGIIAWWWNRKHAKTPSSNLAAFNRTTVNIDADVSLRPGSSSGLYEDDVRDNDGNNHGYSYSNDNTTAGNIGSPTVAPSTSAYPARTDEQLQQWRQRQADQEADETSSTVIVLASGLVLGEGIISILNLVLASSDVPHL